ncbi:MAG: RDD family protein [Bacilli bacterium]|nr:RDD family protein [Bacilli bacterium]MBQ6404591.1 RDD family protein [Bacilli bacterium]
MKKKTKKAYFVQRLIAFLIDILLVYTITSIVAMPFVDTKESKKVNEEINELLDQTTKQEITTREFADRNMDLSYRVARKNGIISLITLVMNILYFMVFQLYNKGQTIGKQIMKIRVKSDHGELTMNQMIFRAFIANSILLDLITFMFMLSNSRLVYFYGITTFSTLQYSITLISIFMILIRKDGCAIHDLLVHTKVVKE